MKKLRSFFNMKKLRSFFKKLKEKSGFRWMTEEEYSEINPRTGLPMNGGVDVGGNPYGSDRD